MSSQTPAAPPQATPPTFRFDDAAVERALLTGEQRGLLEDYFGPDEYEELRDLARDASTRSLRSAARVLVLPGIMGSKLGRKRAGWFDDVLWLDPFEIAIGRLTELRLNGGAGNYTAVGVILYAYLRLKLKLRAAGLDAEFHAYDWRRPLDELGRELAGRIKAEGRPVHLVAHSMGGLVSRAALKAGAPNVQKLIMLGTPNYGSFAPVQVMRGVYGTVQSVAKMDLRHDAVFLCDQVFNSFPGLYAMLPAPEKYSALDLFDAANWPTSAPRPVAALLKAARNTQKALAGADERFYLIAGVNKDTVTGMERTGSDFAYTISPDGDGTVPLDFARLDGILPQNTYYVEEGHGELQNNPLVQRAVHELIASGATTTLPTTRPPARRAVRTVLESELRAREETRAAGPMGTREMREALCDVAAPAKRETTAVAAAAATASAPAAAQPLQGLVIGRRRQARLELRLAHGSIADADARACVIGAFRNVAPSGAARAIDERLDGAIADFTARRMISSSAGEIFSIPTGRSALRADMIVFAGLGAFDRFNADVQQLVAENVIRMLVRTRVEDLATVMIGAGTGQSTATILQNLFTGFLRGLRDADTHRRFRGVTLCETDPERYAEIRSEVQRLAATPLFEDIELTIDEVQLPAPATRALARREPDPAYLLFRTEPVAKGRFLLRSSILSSGARAALVSAQVEKTDADFTALLAKLDGIARGSGSLKALDQLGRELAAFAVPDAVCAELVRMRERHLVVVHDARSSRLPWEILRVDEWAPALEAGLSHRYMEEDLPVASWAEQKRADTTLDVLLVVNPTEDLAGADAEADRLRQIAAERPIRLTELRHKAATRAAVIAELRSGAYEALHYAGHAYFDKNDPSQCGLICSDGTLRGSDLRGLSSLPGLVFFNACESGRVRGGRTEERPFRDRSAAAASIAETLLRAGIANFLGTYWPVGDESAMRFATSFYGDVLAGKSLGAALTKARGLVRELGSHDWADYLFYGNHEFALKTTPGKPDR